MGTTGAQLFRDSQAFFAERQRAIDAGPPAGRHVTQDNWASWIVYRRIACPGRRQHCTSEDCAIGALCREMEAIGLYGDGQPLPRRDRPTCGARNRQGNPCSVKVEPGKRRCRFHGGLSTGPKTEAGRAAIAAAQRRRWDRARSKKRTVSIRIPIRASPPA